MKESASAAQQETRFIHLLLEAGLVSLPAFLDVHRWNSFFPWLYDVGSFEMRTLSLLLLFEEITQVLPSSTAAERQSMAFKFRVVNSEKSFS